ncbi:MAG: hypothetical protein ED559_13195 [Phycisphaera sp.]|nr:MAG: hypothetical protein ED559_13195 [Phycisphaera sp.]
MRDRDRDIFIALIDAGLDESAVLSFIEGDSSSAAGVIEALGKDAALAELVWQLRSDRDAIRDDAEERPMPAATQAMVSAVLGQEISDELDAGDFKRIEETGTASREIVKPTHKQAKPRRPRQHRSLRLPARTPRVVGSLGVAAIIVMLLSIALPNIDLSTFEPAEPSTPLAQGDTSNDVLVATPGPSNINPLNTDESLADNSTDRARSSFKPDRAPITVNSADQALALAREGRLIIRLTSVRNSTTADLSNDLTTGSGLMRFASIDGPAQNNEALALDRSLPKLEEPIMAAAIDSAPNQPRLEAERNRVGSYMLRVEPTERAFTMLLAKLRSYPGVSIELIGAPSAVTTPGSASDLADLASSPTDWQARITVPVVVDSIR